MKTPGEPLPATLKIGTETTGGEQDAALRYTNAGDACTRPARLVTAPSTSTAYAPAARASNTVESPKTFERVPEPYAG